MYNRLKADKFSVAMTRVLAILLVVIAAGFIAAALDAPGISMSTTAGVLVGALAVVALTLVVRNAQLKARERQAKIK